MLFVDIYTLQTLYPKKLKVQHAVYMCGCEVPKVANL